MDERPHPASDKSIVDLLKQDYDEIAAIKDVYIPVAGWERTGLAIKYRLPESGRELDHIARKVFGETDKKDQYGRGLKISMDTIIALSEGLYVKPQGVENYVQLDPKETGNAVTLADGEELSAIFGWNGEIKSARDVLKKLFSDNDLRIISHSEKLNRWLVDTKADLDVELWQMGEVI